MRQRLNLGAGGPSSNLQNSQLQGVEAGSLGSLVGDLTTRTKREGETAKQLREAEFMTLALLTDFTARDATEAL